MNVRHCLNHCEVPTMRAVIKIYFFLLSRVWPKMAAMQAGKLLFTPQLPVNNAAIPDPDEVLHVSEETCVKVWRGTGPTIMLLHGWSGAVSQFSDLLTRLLQHGYRVVAPVPKGHHYQGECLSHPGEFIRAVEHVLSSQAVKVHAAIGHSLGGAALALHNIRDSRFNKLVLVGAPANLTGVLNRFASMLGLNQRGLDALYDVADSRVGTSHRVLDAAGNLSRIARQTLVVHDTQDKEVPFRDAEQFVTTYPYARLFKTEGLGHRRILNSPAVIDEIIDFIQ